MISSWEHFKGATALWKTLTLTLTLEEILGGIAKGANLREDDDDEDEEVEIESRLGKKGRQGSDKKREERKSIRKEAMVLNMMLWWGVLGNCSEIKCLWRGRKEGRVAFLACFL